MLWNHLILGESTTTPPQGVNDIIILYPSLLDLKCRVVTLVQSDQNIILHVE